MIIPQQVKRDFEHTKRKTGNDEVYHKVMKSDFAEYGGFCDLYVDAVNGQIETSKVVLLNDFVANYKTFIPEILDYLNNSLNPFEKKIKWLIDRAKFTIDVIDIPAENSKYDLVMICGKSYNFFFVKGEIALRVEFKDNAIKSIQRKSDITEDNG